MSQPVASRNLTRSVVGLAAGCLTAGSCLGWSERGQAATPLTPMQATLTSHVPLQAKPGSHFLMTWTLSNGQGTLTLGNGTTFSVRLTSRDGKTATTADAKAPQLPKSSPTLEGLTHPTAPYRA